jgi:RNA polymerase sigma-70 factor (ECF subfamily)
LGGAGSGEERSPSSKIPSSRTGGSFVTGSVEVGVKWQALPAPERSADGAAPDQWLAAFHRGDRRALARCYEEHLRTVNWAVGQVLQGVDRENVVHDVFCRLLAREELRRNFGGGNFGAWLITVARRQAIDYRRRRDHEQPAGAEVAALREAEPPVVEETVHLRALADRFRRVLPARWEPVFRARFLEQLDQREAARRLGMRRTTLAYQELQIRRLLRKFVLERDP